jgi:2-phospho-L-lactate guanylyltransferase
MSGIWAVVPVKETAQAKQRLEPLLPAPVRRRLMLAMVEDVLAALAAAPGLAGIAVVTVDPDVARLARRYSARLLEDGARDGHTGAVAAAARRLAAERCEGLLTVPGDIPLVTAAEITAVIGARRPSPSFTIVPSHDERGSNAVLLSPPDAVPLAFGDDSFRPHLRAAEARGIAPAVLHLPGIALDIDTPADLAAFARQPSQTRARGVLDESGVLPVLFASWPGSARSSTPVAASRSRDIVDARTKPGHDR